MSTIAPPSNFNDSTYQILTPTQLQAHTQTKVNLGAAREARTSIMVPENSIYKHFFLQYPEWSTEARTSDHNSGLGSFVNSIHEWLVAALSTLMKKCFTRKSVNLHRQNNVYKVACSGESFFLQMIPHRSFNANSS